MSADTTTPLLNLLLMQFGNDQNNWVNLWNKQVFDLLEGGISGNCRFTGSGGTGDIIENHPPFLVNGVRSLLIKKVGIIDVRQGTLNPGLTMQLTFGATTMTASQLTTPTFWFFNNQVTDGDILFGPNGPSPTTHITTGVHLVYYDGSGNASGVSVL